MMQGVTGYGGFGSSPFTFPGANVPNVLLAVPSALGFGGAGASAFASAGGGGVPGALAGATSYGGGYGIGGGFGGLGFGLGSGIGAGLGFGLGFGGLGTGIGAGIGVGGASAQAQAQATSGGLGGGGGILGLLLLSLLGGGDLFGGGGGGGGFFPPPQPQPYGWGPPPPQNYGPTGYYTQAPPPPAPPSFVTQDVAPGATVAKVWGDPHFEGFEGGKYDVMGEAGKTYNIISDKDLQYNAQYTGKGDGITYLGAAGFKIGNAQVGTHKIEYAKGGGPAKIDGQAMEKGKEYKFDSGLVDEKGNHVQATAKWNGKELEVNSGEYDIKLTDQGDHLDQASQVTKLGVQSDGVKPHGLLGQSADGRGARNGKQGKGAQGEGAIDGTFKDYEVGGLFDDNFKYNRFGANATAARQVGVDAGKAGNAN